MIEWETYIDRTILYLEDIIYSYLKSCKKRYETMSIIKVNWIFIFPAWFCIAAAEIIWKWQKIVILSLNMPNIELTWLNYVNDIAICQPEALR